MRKLIFLLTVLALGGCISCDNTETAPMSTTEEIPLETVDVYRPYLRDVIKICIPQEDISAYSDDDTVPEWIKYEVEINRLAIPLALADG